MFSVTATTFYKYKQLIFKNKFKACAKPWLSPSKSLFIWHLLKEPNALEMLMRSSVKHLDFLFFIFLPLKHFCSCHDFGHSSFSKPQKNKTFLSPAEIQCHRCTFSVQKLLPIYWQKLNKAQIAAFKVTPRALLS